MEDNIDEKNASPLQDAVKAGVIIAAINIAITVLMYVIDPALMANWWFGLLFIVLNLVLVVVFGIKFRNSIGGFLSFGKAYLHGFVTLAVAGLIGVLFNILLYTVIDPELSAVMTDAAIDNTTKLMESMGAPAESIDEAVIKMEEDMADNFSIGGFLKQYGISLIVYAVLALITGLIVKKNEPMDDMG